MQMWVSREDGGAELCLHNWQQLAIKWWMAHEFTHVGVRSVEPQIPPRALPGRWRVKLKERCLLATLVRVRRADACQWGSTLQWLPFIFTMDPWEPYTPIPGCHDERQWERGAFNRALRDGHHQILPNQSWTNWRGFTTLSGHEVETASNGANTSTNVKTLHGPTKIYPPLPFANTENSPTFEHQESKFPRFIIQWDRPRLFRTF